MKTGMLWFDNDPNIEITAKVKRAINYYHSKYGHTPDLCYVHPSMVEKFALKSNGIEIRTDKQVLPNHFWLGVNEMAVLASQKLS